ncbi:MAG: helix-turn-helix transcriptional regulator [Thaumarchaeota archaeon]|nr:helix-turn-helix transcriptional regulator [Nitrososphaerota archaeon]
MQILSPLRVKVDKREEQILRALLDKHCLSILSITKENAMTASMICSCCNISPSAAYRKLKLLQKLNLLRATYTIQPNGKKSMSFQSKIIRINILLCENQLQIHTNFVPLE